MTHPFWSRFREGRLDRAQLRSFALNYYQHVKRTRLYAAAVLSCTPIEGIQVVMTSVLWDEYGNGDPQQSHPEQFRRVLTALELTEADWDHVPELPELAIYTDVHFRLCRDGSFWTGLGVVGVAMELPIPALYDHLIEGFTKAGVKKTDLEFFVQHGPMDILHANLLIEAMAPHLSREEDREAMRYGIIRSLDTRSVLMDGMYRVVWGR